MHHIIKGHKLTRPPTAQHTLSSLQTDNSCIYLGGHNNTWTRAPPSSQLSSLVSRSTLCDGVCHFLNNADGRETRENLELTQNESSARTKAVLILLNSSAWSTAPSPLINSASSCHRCARPPRCRFRCDVQCIELVCTHAALYYWSICLYECTCMWRWMYGLQHDSTHQQSKGDKPLDCGPECRFWFCQWK